MTPVSREIEERLDRFIDLLLQWQDSTNLVGDSTIHTLWTRHVADSLQLLPMAPAARTFADLGSGAGFPGLVIGCALTDVPGAIVHLVESNNKKAAFLREAARVTGAAVRVHPMRIEAFTKEFDERLDVVTARALAPVSQLFAYVHPLLKKGATALFPKGQDVDDELTEASKCWRMQFSKVASLTSDRSCILIVRAAEQKQPDESRNSIRTRNETGRR